MDKLERSIGIRKQAGYQPEKSCRYVALVHEFCTRDASRPRARINALGLHVCSGFQLISLACLKSNSSIPNKIYLTLPTMFTIKYSVSTSCIYQNVGHHDYIYYIAIKITAKHYIFNNFFACITSAILLYCSIYPKIFIQYNSLKLRGLVYCTTTESNRVYQSKFDEPFKSLHRAFDHL